MSEEGKTTRRVLYKTNGVMVRFMRMFGLEVYVAPLPKKRTVQGGSSKMARLQGREVNWLRVPMYSAIVGYIVEQGRAGLEAKKAVELGGSEGTIIEALRQQGAVAEVAPDYPAIDIENIPYPDNSYDVLVLDQVIEHVKHPWRAVEEVRRVLKKDGVCICTSVLVYPLHKGYLGTFGDYYRFSPDGFKQLFSRFDTVVADGWGNAEALRLVYDHSDRGPEGSAPLSKEEAGRIGLYNHTDGMNYLMTWCIAKKVD